MLQNIILIRNIFYKCFLIGFIFYIMSAFFYVFDKHWSANIACRIFNISMNEFNLLFAYFIGWCKMIIMFFFLVPALALHWTGYNLKKANK